MKRVIFKTMENNQVVLASNFTSLLDNHLFIGFEPCTSSKRYFVRTKAPLKGVAIRPAAFWDSDANQEKPDNGTYFVFDTEKELLTWMAKAGTKE